MKLKLTKSKFSNQYILILGLLNIIDGLVMILSLGFYTSQLTLPYVLHIAQKKKIKN